MWRVAFAGLLLGLAGCAAQPPCHTHSQLYFGANAAPDMQVDATAWREFVDGAVLPRFPDGFTVLEGQGVYRSAQSGATVRESTRILTVLHPGDAEGDRKLEAIAQDYKARFRQESVLRVDLCAAYRL